MPVSCTQDAIGPIARHVVVAAAMLQVMAAEDPADPHTGRHLHPNYVSSLNANALKGKRIGVLRAMFGSKPEHQEVNAVMEYALAALTKAGATLLDLDAPDLDADKLIAQNDVQKYEFKAETAISPQSRAHRLSQRMRSTLAGATTTQPSSRS
jgi:amidase